MSKTIASLITISLFAALPACKKKATPAKRHMCAHKKNPAMGEYVVVFKGMTRKFIQQISEEIHGKFFVTVEKGGTAETSPKSGAHGFTVVEKDPRGACIIEVVPAKSVKPDMGVNIQMFIKERGKQRRIFNPGTFNLTKMMAASKNSDPAHFLSFLIVRLTFK